LRFEFAVFERKAGTSFLDFGSGSVTTSPWGLAQRIFDAARPLITRPAEGQGEVATIDSLLLHEVWSVRNLFLPLREHFVGEGSIQGSIREDDGGGDTGS
jgi:hypothetical protein